MNSEINSQYKNVFTKFVSICDENNLWYSLANNTLLSVKTKNNYFDNSGIIEVFVTKSTFTFLKQNYSDNLIDFSCSDRFFLSTPFFYIRNNNRFIKIIIIVPTSIEKIKKFNCIKNKIKYNYSNFLTFKKGYNFYTKFIFFWLRIFSRFCSPIEQNEFYDSLYSENYRGFFSINSLNEKNVKNWFPNITFRVEEVIFLGIKSKIIVEYNSFLIARYGDEWKNGVEIKTYHFDYEKLFLN